MRVKTTLLCLALILVLGTLAVTTGCAVITGSGTLLTQQFNYSDFTKVELDYAFEAEIVRSDTYLVEVTLDDNLFDYLDIRQNGDTLKITMESGNIYTRSEQLVVIHMPDLERLELSGASLADVSGFSSTHDLDIEISGASTLNVDDMSSGEVSLEISGASKIRGDFTMTDATFELSGASSIRLDGSAGDIDLEISGASWADLSGFLITDARVDISGASSATLNASGVISGELSGASKLEYLGNPTFDNFSSRDASSISPK